MVFDINFVNWFFSGFEIDLLRENLSLVSLIVIDYIYVLYSLIVISILSLIVLESRSADKMIKKIGQVGTGVLATIGAVDSSLNLYDRYKESRKNKGSDSGGDSYNSEKGKGEGDNNKQTPDNKGNNNSDNNTNNENK